MSSLWTRSWPSARFHRFIVSMMLLLSILSSVVIEGDAAWSNNAVRFESILFFPRHRGKKTSCVRPSPSLPPDVMAGAHTGSMMRPSTTAAAAAASASSPTASSELANGGNFKRKPQMPRKKAVVVGGGPAGLAAAITLANEPHGYDVSVIEASTSPTSLYDPTRAYLFNVNERGQMFTKRFPMVQRGLMDAGVPVKGFFTIRVPADPHEPIPEIATFGAAGAHLEDEETNYWIPRYAIIRVLLDVITEQNERQLQQKRGGSSNYSNSTVGKIQVTWGAECTSVRPSSPDVPSSMIVDSRDASTNATVSYLCSLVIGADGINSRVRNCLAEDSVGGFNHWPNFEAKKFRVKKWKSPSTGLRIKVLQIQPQFQISSTDANGMTSYVATKSDIPYFLTSTYQKSSNFIFLGLLPISDNDVVRPCNIVTRPNHDVWKITDGESMRRWFAKGFPRLSLDGADSDGSAVSSEEWERFAQAQGTRLPFCQFCPGLQVASPDRQCGVVLIGDAIHCFPPDIGQGVNAALGDVVALDDALRSIPTDKNDHDAETNLGNALAKYESMRILESRALVRLARVGAPYQYQQPLPIDRFRHKLWLYNVRLRTLLNKLSRGFIPPSAFQLSQDPKLTFRQIMHRADSVTVGITSLMCLLVFGVARLLIKNILR